MRWMDTKPEERIWEWRAFRHRMENSMLSNSDVYLEVAKFWANLPYGARSIDYYAPETWPDPWEMLHSNQNCKNTISLLIYYTLVLVDFADTPKIHLALVDDSTDRYLVVMINNTHILNYELGKVSVLHDIENLRIIEVFDNSKVRQIV